MSRVSLFLLLVAACGGDPSAPDAPPPMIDATPPGPDAPWLPDGTPTRMACTNNLGSALGSVHGRLDGYLVAIVPTTTHSCNGDDTHVHLQVKSNGAVYDVAVNVSDPANVDFLAEDLPLPDGAWSEGWHAGQAALLDYPSIGVHAADFTGVPAAQLETTLNSELANANHVSIFMTPYGPDGGHLVHRNGNGNDGAIVIEPLGRSRLLMFHFANQAF
ncbi:MAG TPA: hypothetical protein VL463_12010 [Kofleriaceae bacterium]|jgi:hypothetical protein|nr:hypothetical protein [Kofleriaceae bacterium]